MKERDAASRNGREKRETEARSNDAVETAQRAEAAAPPDPSPQDPELRREMIAVAAYYRAERRGFAADGELGDWLAAEAEIDGPHE